MTLSAAVVLTNLLRKSICCHRNNLPPSFWAPRFLSGGEENNVQPAVQWNKHPVKVHMVALLPLTSLRRVSGWEENTKQAHQGSNLKGVNGKVLRVLREAIRDRFHFGKTRSRWSADCSCSLRNSSLNVFQMSAFWYQKGALKCLCVNMSVVLVTCVENSFFWTFLQGHVNNSVRFYSLFQFLFIIIVGKHFVWCQTDSGQLSERVLKIKCV